MPFNFSTYRAKCDSMSTEELQLEWQNYTRQLSSGASLTATSILMSPVTNGISLVGLGLSVPQLHNARKKRSIVVKKMNSYNAEPQTRRRDIVFPMAYQVAASGLSFGLTPSVAATIGAEAGAKGVEYLISHAALDTLWFIIDEAQSYCHHKISHRRLQRQKLLEKQQQMSKSSISEYPTFGMNGRKNQTIDEKYQIMEAESYRPHYLDQGKYSYDDDLPPSYSTYLHQYKSNSSIKSASHLSQLIDTNSSCQLASGRRFSYDQSRVANDDLSCSLQPCSTNSRWLSTENPDHRSRILSRRKSSFHTDTATKTSLLQAWRSRCGHESDQEKDSESEVEDGCDDNEEEEEDYTDEDNKENKKSRFQHVLTMNEEISLLKATILRLEMERRGLALDVNSNADLSAIPTQRKTGEKNPNVIFKAVDPVSEKVSGKATSPDRPEKIRKKPETNQTQRVIQSFQMQQEPFKISPAPKSRAKSPKTVPQSNSLNLFPQNKDGGDPSDIIQSRDYHDDSTPSFTHLVSSQQPYNDVLSSQAQHQQRPLRKKKQSENLSSPCLQLSLESESDAGIPNLFLNDGQLPTKLSESDLTTRNKCGTVGQDQNDLRIDPVQNKNLKPPSMIIESSIQSATPNKSENDIYPMSISKDLPQLKSSILGLKLEKSSGEADKVSDHLNPQSPLIWPESSPADLSLHSHTNRQALRTWRAPG